MRACIVLGLLFGSLTATAAAVEPLLVLLTETGEVRDGLPVLAVHPGAEATAAALTRGASGTLLRVYAMLQTLRQAEEGVSPEPAYVLLSTRQGGFARQGFYLGDEDKSQVDFVDVHQDWPATGDFGALDQVVPHELCHAIRRQLVGPLADGNGNQVHALGVRTDRVNAFNEGFAEHLQVMAVDDPDADPATRALAEDREALARVEHRLDAYRRELTAALAVAPRMRMGFVLWYNNGEDVLRYAAVKANAFAREPDVPASLLSRRDPYAAYLLESVLPGDPDGAVKSVSRMAASEGVVSALFYRWATNEDLRDTYRDDAFYAPFGVEAGQVGPLENLYLKLFYVFYVHKPQDALAVIAGYRETFPDEAPFVDAVAAEVFHGEPRAAGEIWLANPAFATGTTLFDQYRGLPRVHTFDLNAASLVDLIGVPGVDLELARAIRGAAPYAGIDDLAAVPGVTAELVARFHELSGEMTEMRETFSEDDEEDLSIKAILMPYAWRGGEVLAVAALLATLLYRIVRSYGPTPPPRWWRTVANGLAAALVSAAANWAVDGLGWSSLVAVGILFGLPGALWCLRKTRRAPAAWNVLAAWLVAALPAVVLTTAWR